MKQSTYSLLLLIALSGSVSYFLLRDDSTPSIETYDIDGIPAYLEYEDARTVALAKDKPLLLWFTGYALGCRRMEQLMIQETGTRNFLLDEVVVAHLLVDDSSPLPTEEIDTVFINGKERVLKTIGHKNMRLEIERFQTNALPFFVLLSPNGKHEFGQFGYTQDNDSVLTLLNDALAKFETYD